MWGSVVGAYLLHKHFCAALIIICVMPISHWSMKDTWATTWQNKQSDCVASEDSDEPGHPPSLIRVFAVRRKKAWVPSYPLSAQQRLWSDWADAQADLSHRWAHSHFVGFVTSRLIYIFLLRHSGHRLFFWLKGELRPVLYIQNFIHQSWWYFLIFNLIYFKISWWHLKMPLNSVSNKMCKRLVNP